MKTILVVDDEPDVVDVVAATLQDEGYRVVSAFDGVQGLQRVREAHPDLLICDMMMPSMDGAEMGRQIRNDPSYRHLPIVVASVLDEAEIKRAFPSYDGYLRKPFRFAALLDLVGTLLKTARSH